MLEFGRSMVARCFLVRFSLDSVTPTTSNSKSVEPRRLWSSMKWYGSEGEKKLSFFLRFSSFGVTYFDKFSNILVSELIWLKSYISFDISFFATLVNLMFLPFKVWMKFLLFKFEKSKSSLVHIMQNHLDFSSFCSSL